MRSHRTRALSDPDPHHPDVASPSRKADIPAETSHGKCRVAVYFNGRPGKSDQDQNPQ